MTKQPTPTDRRRSSAGPLGLGALGQLQQAMEKPNILSKGSRLIHVQTGLLALALVLSLVVTLSAPYSKTQYLMQMKTSSEQTYRFGPMGWCVLYPPGREHVKGMSACTRATGYNITAVLVEATSYRGIPHSYAEQTGQLVLIPATVGVTLLALLVTALSTLLPLLDIAVVLGLVSFLLSVAALGCEWALFGPLQKTLHDHVAGSARWGPAHWILLITTVLLALCPIVGTVEWIRSRRRRRDTGVYAPLKSMKNAGYQF